MASTRLVFIEDKARELIQKNGRTYKWIASYMGISPGTLSQILRGRPTSARSAKLFALAMECDTSEFLTEINLDAA